VELNNSTLTATAVSIAAAVAIMADESHLDLAGVTISSTKAAIRTKNTATALFSVSQIHRMSFVRYVHGVYRVTPGSPL
jgi:hypothetical protein